MVRTRTGTIPRGVGFGGGKRPTLTGHLERDTFLGALQHRIPQNKHIRGEQKPVTRTIQRLLWRIRFAPSSSELQLVFLQYWYYGTQLNQVASKNDREWDTHFREIRLRDSKRRRVTHAGTSSFPPITRQQWFSFIWQLSTMVVNTTARGRHIHTHTVHTLHRYNQFERKQSYLQTNRNKTSTKLILSWSIYNKINCRNGRRH